MTYRINNGNVIQFDSSNCPVLAYTGNVVVAIDPSKTNMGVVVGTDAGNKLAHIELSGKGCDTTDYCCDLKRFFGNYLSKAHIVLVGVEQTVQYKGYDYYRSQMVLTEIRATILALFRELFNIKVKEINNYAWKGAVLPDGYRGHKEKGSKRWLAEHGVTGLSDDVTDAICIYLYLMSFVQEHETLECTQGEEPVNNYRLCIVPEDFELEGEYTTYKANPDVNIRGNLGYYTNHTMESYILITPITMLTFDVIYSAKCFFPMIPESDVVKLLVMRC